MTKPHMKKHETRVLRLEALESRLPLSTLADVLEEDVGLTPAQIESLTELAPQIDGPGVFTSLCANGVLAIVARGDTGSNLGIAMSNDIEAGRYVVKVESSADNIKGPTEFEAEMLQGLVVSLGAGNDTLRIGGRTHENTAEQAAETSETGHDEEEPLFVFTEDVTIFLGDGDNQFEAKFIEIGGAFTLVAGSGNDKIDLGRGSGFTRGGHGETASIAIEMETVEAGSSEEEGCEDEGGPPADFFVSQYVSVDTGSGDDAVKVGFTNVMGDINLTTGEGADLVVVGRGPMFQRGATSDVFAVTTNTVITADITSLSEDSGSDEHGEEGGPPPDVKISGALNIHTGEDNDAVKVAFAATDGNANIITGSGDDVIVTGRGPIQGRHGQGAGSGGESHDGATSLTTSSEESSKDKPSDFRVGGNLSIDSEFGDDMVVVRNTQTGQVARLFDQDGHNRIAVDNLRVALTAHFLTGWGNDVIAVLNSHFALNLHVQTMSGDDSVLLYNSYVDRQTAICTGYGADQVVLHSNVFNDRITVLQMQGNSILAARDNLFTGEGRLDGGSGGDENLLYFDPDQGELKAVCYTIETTEFLYDDVFQEIDEIFGQFLPGKLGSEHD